jgi:hypothetical protein
MAKGKAEFLRSLKEAVAQQKETREKDLVGVRYLARWAAGLGDAPDRNDVAWFKAFLDHLERHQKTDPNPFAQQCQDLFADCNLNPSDPKDRELLISALAQTIYPREAGARQKWSAEQYAQLRRDIYSMEMDGLRKASAIDAPSDDDHDLSNEEIAKLLLKSKELSARYATNRKGTREKVNVATLRKRIGEVEKYDHSYDITLWEFDYILRGDPKKGPACAAGLPVHMAFPRGSAAAQEAATLEKQLFSEIKAFFDSLDIPMGDWQLLECRRTARKLARWTVRQNLSEAQK